MITWDLSTGTLATKQVFNRPVVYLDHWAIRTFSSDAALGNRFIQALKARQGTWAISVLNLMEFIPMSDEWQAVQFENLVEAAIPNLFFLDFQPIAVMDRERALIQGGSTNAPYGDVELLNTFAHIKPDSPRGFSAKNLASVIVRYGDELKPALDSFKSTVVSRLELMRADAQADDELLQRVKGSQEGAAAQRTWLYLRELIGGILVDPKKKITPNDAMDLMHAVVPIAYCHFVLLDAQWVHRTNSVRARLLQHNIPLTPAEVFSEKNIEQFFNQFEDVAVTADT